MNIIGENFPEFVKTQVEQRELIYGERERDNQTLTYLNSNTSWIKLGSSVDVDTTSPKYIDLELGTEEFGGSEMAKRAVLFNGTSNQDIQFSGISRENSIFNTATYGFGGNQFGLSPMPGITSITTKYKNRGSLRRATVSLVAHNTKQFEIIELLYLRLGYSVLLEFGHSLYLDDEGQVENMGPTLMNDFLEGRFKNNDDLLKAILEKREEYRGNYDALLARVINFSWNLKEDGTYDITLELTSIGDVIASIKMNSSPSLLNRENINQDEETRGDFTEELINLNSKISELAQVFYDKILEVKKTNNLKLIGKDKDSVLNEEQNIINYFRGNAKVREADAEDKNDFFLEQLYFVRFGELLRLIEDNVIFSSNTLPYIKFDKDIRTNLILTDTYIFSNKAESFGTFSTDPRKIRTDVDFQFLKGDEVDTGQKINESYPLGNFNEKIGDSQVGRLMNVYLEMGFILQLFLELADENNDVSLDKFLEKICNSISTTLGGLNKIEHTVDDTTNEIIFRDQTPLPNRSSIIQTLNSGSNPTPVSFNIFGYTGNKSGFVQDFSFTTQLSNNFATLTTIGAQARGQVVGEDATAFSNWNQGLTDRLNKEKNSPISFISPSSQDITTQFLESNNIISTKLSEAEQTVKQAILRYYGAKKRGRRNWSGTQDLTSIVKNYIKEKRNERLNRLKSLEENTKTVNTTGFLPLNLSLKLNGLSGFKIYQKFNVNQRILPKNYNRNLEFIIRGITNTVNENGWSTEIETFATVPPDLLLPGEDQLPDTIDNSIEFDPGVGEGPLKLLQNGVEITQEDLLFQLNPSTEIQSRFRNFLLTLNSNLPGYSLQINSVYRSFEKQAQLKLTNDKNAPAGESTHNYGAAIDFNVITPSGITLRKAGPKENWISIGIVDDAKRNGIQWGGNFSEYVDCVHFYVNINTESALQIAKDQFKVADTSKPSESKKINGRAIDVNNLIIS